MVKIVRVAVSKLQGKLISRVSRRVLEATRNEIRLHFNGKRKFHSMTEYSKSLIVSFHLQY